MEHENDKIIADNLKLARSYIFLKREVILLRSEREDREKKIMNIESHMNHITNEFSSLKISYNNIKEMQNYNSEENANLKMKIDRLESMIIELGYVEKNKLKYL